jgi:hypothetical protein
MTILYGILIILGLGGIFALSYLLNKKTKKPEGCEDKLASCSHCPIVTCGHNPVHKGESKNE